jgi:hypothetical protein
LKTLEDWLLHLESLHPKGQAGIELGLERIRRSRRRSGSVRLPGHHRRRHQRQGLDLRLPGKHH